MLVDRLAAAANGIRDIGWDRAGADEKNISSTTSEIAQLFRASDV